MQKIQPINIVNHDQYQDYRNHFKKALKLANSRQNLPTEPENYRIRTQLSPKHWKDYIAPEILQDAAFQHQQRSKRNSQHNSGRVKNPYIQKNFQQLYQDNDEIKPKSTNKEAYDKKRQLYRQKKEEIMNKIRLLQGHQPATRQSPQYDNNSKAQSREQSPIDFMQQSETEVQKKKNLEERIKILEEEVRYLPMKFERRLKQELMEFQKRLKSTK